MQKNKQKKTSQPTQTTKGLRREFVPKFSEPGVSDDGSEDWCEVAEAAESMIDSCGEVLVPFQIGDKIERQQRCEQTTTGQRCQQSPTLYNIIKDHGQHW